MASGVVLSWRRVANLPRICDRLRAQPFVDDVVVWQNDAETVSDADRAILESLGATICWCPRNAYTLGRFHACARAKHRLILTQDDDVDVRCWPAIHAAVVDPWRLVVAMPDRHIAHHDTLRWGNAHEVLLGWGAAFDRRLIGPAFAPWMERRGEDELLTRKADRIFSIMLDRAHVVLPADFEEIGGARDHATALWMRRDHERLSRDARRACRDILAEIKEERDGRAETGDPDRR